MNNHNPEIGDVIKIQRGLYWHAGVYVGSRAGDLRDVVHNDKSKGVVFSTLADFSGGRTVLIHRQACGDRGQRQAVAERAKSLIGKKYNLLNFNCEHAATWAQTGRAESPQLTAALIMILIAVFGMALVARKK